MRCPVHGTRMDFHDYGMVVGNQCTACEGMYIPSRVVDRLLDPESIELRAGACLAICPACAGSMQHIAVQVPAERMPFGVYVRPAYWVNGRQCTACRGYWLQFADIDRIPDLGSANPMGDGPGGGDIYLESGNGPIVFLFALPWVIARACWRRSPIATLFAVALLLIAAFIGLR